MGPIRDFATTHARLLVKCLAVAAGMIINPFGINDITEQATRAIVTRIYAPFYDNVGQQHTTAVVISDESAEPIGGYPLPFSQHARALRTILCMDPAGVFIDINFRSARGDSEGLAQFADHLSYRQGPDGCGPVTAETLKGDGVAPVFLAVVRNDAARCSSILSAGKDECKAMAPFKPLLDVTRPVDITGTVQHGQVYHLKPEEASPETAFNPAVQLARALCARIPGVAPFCDDDASHFERPLVVRWGQYISPLSASDGGAADCGVTSDVPTGLERGWAALKSLGHDIRGGRVGEPVQPCLYTDQVSIGAFMKGDVNANAHLKKLIKDRIVIYGTDITALPDRVTSPVHGSVPGLFVHAMAADNLVTLGRSYWQETPKVLGLSIANWLELAFALAILIVASRCETWTALIATVSAFALVSLTIALSWTYLVSFEPLNFVLVSAIGLIDLAIDGPNENRAWQPRGG